MSTLRYNFHLEKGEQRDVVLKLPEEEERGAIYGRIVDQCDKAVKNAIVKLLVFDEHCKDYCKLEPITHTFTDDCGQFLFGPLCPHKKYSLLVNVNDVCIKKDCFTPCEDCKKCLEKKECKDCRKHDDDDDKKDHDKKDCDYRD